MKSHSCRHGAHFAFVTLASAASGVPIFALGAPAVNSEVTAPQMIDAFEVTFGVHALRASS
jgi:hypothetical protein